MTSAEPIVSSDSRLMSPPLSVTPCSACSVLSPALLTCLHNFVHVPGWPNLENVAIRQSRMMRHELYSMIHVPRLKDENATELFFGFGTGAVGRCHPAVLPIQGQGGIRPPEALLHRPSALWREDGRHIQACIEHGVSLALSHDLDVAF